MDKNDALSLSKSYLKRLQNTDLNFSEAWLFGSFAKGNQNDNSDIDLAIVLKETFEHTFETDVKLMILRQGEETRIEPHAFSKEEFDFRMPFIEQIIKYGVKIEL